MRYRFVFNHGYVSFVRLLGVMAEFNQELDELAFRFFKLFARFESTLKERGYVRSRDNSVEADWDRFANQHLGSEYRQKLEAVGLALDYILTNPPKRQILSQDNEVQWAEVANDDQSVQAMFGHIRRIRNDLYHGAKFNGTWFDPERDTLLLSHALAVLEELSPWLGEEK